MLNLKILPKAAKVWFQQFDAGTGVIAVAAGAAVAALSSQWWVLPLVVFWVIFTFAEGVAAGAALHEQGKKEELIAVLQKVLKDAIARCEKDGIPVDREAVAVVQNSCAINGKCAKNGQPRSCGKCAHADPQQVIVALNKIKDDVDAHVKMQERKKRQEERIARNQAHVDAGGELDLPPIDEDFFSRM